MMFHYSFMLSNLDNSVFGDFYGEKTDREEALRVLTYAADRGVTFWDCANIYRDCELLMTSDYRQQ